MSTFASRRIVPTLALMLFTAASGPGLAAAPFSQDRLLSFAQQAYLKASNTGAEDHFGGQIAISGDTLVVAAASEASGATGVNGNPFDNSLIDSGAVYVFVRSGTTWSQQAYLKASNTGIEDYFGSSVAISGDTLVIGASGEGSNATGVNGNQSNNSAYGAGAAYVFVRSGTTWSQQAYLKASNTGGGDAFGESVAIAGDTIVVGAWLEDSNATGVNGNKNDNSAPGAGAAYVFVRSGATWSQQAYLKASNTDLNDFFGQSVAVSSDTIVVGAHGEDSAALGVNGNQSDNSAGGSGSVYVFVRSGPSWTQQAYLKASNTEAEDAFGAAVSISGDAIVVGSWGEDSAATGVNGNQLDNSAASSGAAYVFARSGTTWSQQAYLKASNSAAGDAFGLSAAISTDMIVVGALSEDSNASGLNGNQLDNSASGSGAAYIFVRSGSTWNQQAYVKASNTGAGDSFGTSAALSSDSIVVGAWLEDSNATGVNGNQGDNSVAQSGAAYVLHFEAEDPPPPAGGWLQTSALPGFRFKALLGGARTGIQVADCVPQTLCIAGAIPTRAELFVRIVGPKGNGKLWAQAVRFPVTQVELWIEQVSSGQINYYLLEALPASTDTLPGINDSLAFDP